MTYRSVKDLTDQRPTEEAGRIQQAARRAKEIAREETRNIVEERHLNDRAAGRVHDYGDAIHGMRERIPQGSRFGDYLGDLADRTEGVADRVRKGDYRGALTETRQFAADHPELFLTIAMGLGAVAGRAVREMGDQGAASPQAGPNVIGHPGGA